MFPRPAASAHAVGIVAAEPIPRMINHGNSLGYRNRALFRIPLVVSEPQATMSELLAQYSVLFAGILDHVLLPLIRPTGYHDHNKVPALTLLIRVFGP